MSSTKQQILTAAMGLAGRQGFRNVTRAAIASRVGIATGTVSYHFETMAKLQDAIMSHAVEVSNVIVVAQGLAEGHKAAKAAPNSLRLEAAKLMAGV